ncbi:MULTISPECIES: endonuclease [unclassified Flavobacterium]|uniref:endonuclease n=1 Tax=unclassified Flavobacterium TaxID=196869 RepID=UPI00129208B4|nr:MULTISPECIES: endonuclease [unclassified Flavobacterium]MQP53204.1 T9SS type A sorting domain-containing protein [Flavobacterium sp. LMO9]MQP62965.1 T9SS type A sorting domain-containing protein [Flavobacterium sp. LMO6]
MSKKILTLIFLLLGISIYSQIVINEIDADTPGTDQLEFVELKSASPNFPLDGYVLVFYNGGSSAPYSGSLSYYAFDLDGYSTDINGIAVFGNNQLVPSPMGVFPNATIQNGPDVVAIYSGNATDFPLNTLATSTNLIDALAYSNANTQPAAMMTTLGITVCTNENAISSVTTHSIQRKNDGSYEVKLPTPRANNDGSGVVLNYISVTTSQSILSEGNSFNFILTTSEPVQNETLIMNFTLINGSFTMSDFSGGLTVSIPVGQTTTQTGIILIDDGLDEGDEEMKFIFQTLPFGYVANNDNIVYRVYDANFATDPWGTPLNPTYNVVTPTIPLGYYDSLEGLSGAALKQELQNIIADPGVVRLHSYADIWEILRSSDRNPNNNNQVWCIYTEQPFSKLDQQNTSSIVGKWNREHIFCQSRGGFDVANGDTADGINVWLPTSAATTIDGVSDAHHIRAVSGQENSSRNNKNYGTVASSTVYNGPSGTQGSWCGDVARALFYMAVRFDGLNVVNGDPSEYLPSTTTASGNIGDLATLLTWNTSDPKDDFEMNRNNYIYTWQMNRNPFIDYPNLSDYIFGANYGQPWSVTLSTQSLIENRVAVYPNPASDYLIVSGLEGSSKIEIYTVTGQLLQRLDFEGEIKIDLDLNVGMYLVKVTNGTESTTKKIIVK